MGTIASPSNPSVRLTAFEDPTITSIENINQKYPILIIKFLNTEMLGMNNLH